MNSPLLYEINTRCWLRELSEGARRPITLAEVPEAEFAKWRGLGFSHIWLMGVWLSGPRARKRALADPHQRQRYSEALPDWQEEDVAGSPYAIGAYQVLPSLGGEEGLREFRRRLHEHGLKLLLDFVPNHLGLDHPWLREHPELFMQSSKNAPGAFPQETSAGVRWLAHGKDPNFPAWSDTVQLDYRLPATRARMIELLHSIAERCDGVRCDMTMLLLNDVFARTWQRSSVKTKLVPGSLSMRPDAEAQASTVSTKADRKSASQHPPMPEFWTEAISSLKHAHPEFLFLAEAYWGLEPRLQALGFDYTYDKELYDRLVARDAAGVQRHLLGMNPKELAASAHFLENHDEPRIASLLSLAEHRAAALVILGLPGMRFLHEGQLSGARRRIPVQLVRRLPEHPKKDVQALYEKLLSALPASSVGQGRSKLLKPRAAWTENPTAENLILVQWQKQPPHFDLVAVNLAAHRSQGCAPLSIAGLAAHNWLMRDLLGEEKYERHGEDLQKQGLYLDLPGHGAQLFHFQPIS